MSKVRQVSGAVIVALAVGWAGAVAGASTPQQCEAAKNKAAGKLAKCRAAERAKEALGRTADYAKCETAFTKAITRVEKPGQCGPTTLSTSTIGSLVDNTMSTVSAAVANQPLPLCGNSVRDVPEECDGSDLGGQSCAGLGFASGGTLGCAPGCLFDVSACTGSRAVLAKSGQTTEYAPGDDGDIQAGLSLSFVDNGDGTVTDRNTGLMWEKKSDDGGLHDKDNAYVWNPGVGSIWAWLVQVNAEGGTGFAGHNDWRIPNIRELQSIVDFGRYNPAADPVFNTACAPGCSVTACSCTVANYYWSSTTLAGSPFYAWDVYFEYGNLNGWDFKDSTLYVRAVRGGL
jgi:hypothetical protein